MILFGKNSWIYHNKYTILATLTALALGFSAVGYFQIRHAQHGAKETALQATKLARTNAVLLKKTARLGKANARNIAELQRQKASIQNLRKTNCGIRLAMLRAAAGAKVTRGPRAAEGYRRIARLFPASNCERQEQIVPRQAAS